MSEPFIAEIRIFANNFAVRGWAFCNGQLISIAQNTALFSLVGTTYGGDGRTTFGLPNLQDRVPMHPGNGPGLTTRRLGERGGAETVTLTEAQMADHDHTLKASMENGEQGSLSGDVVLGRSRNGQLYQTNTSSNLESMDPQSLPAVGSGQAHTNMQPYLTLNFQIALLGLYPSRN